MTKIKIEQLIWDNWNREHIKKHKVSQEEVEEAIERINAHKKGYKGRILLVGRSGKRIISVVVAQEEDKRYYPITARDADKNERRLLYENEEKQK